MKKAKTNAPYIIIGALGAVAAILPLSVYHLIENAGSRHGMHGMHGMVMACERACIVVTAIGILITTIAITSIFLKNTKLSIVNPALLLAGGISIIAAPKAIGLCTTADMACNYLTFPTLVVIGSLIIILSGVKLFAGVVELRKATVTL